MGDFALNFSLIILAGTLLIETAVVLTLSHLLRRSGAREQQWAGLVEKLIDTTNDTTAMLDRSCDTVRGLLDEKADARGIKRQAPGSLTEN